GDERAGRHRRKGLRRVVYGGETGPGGTLRRGDRRARQMHRDQGRVGRNGPPFADELPQQVCRVRVDVDGAQDAVADRERAVLVRRVEPPGRLELEPAGTLEHGIVVGSVPRGLDAVGRVVGGPLAHVDVDDVV